MKISLDWLSEYVDQDLSPEELADLLTMAGLEVEDVERRGASLDGVVVGRVLEAGPHPNADRLTLCQVDVGAEEPVQIVCGAPNVAAGQKVPVATVGTTLLLPSRKNPSEKEPVTIQKAKLRGETSEGMICAEDELGLGDNHDGIMVLDGDAEIGRPFEAYLKARGGRTSDVVLDIAITPNRPDAISHLGVARDVAALIDGVLQRPEVTLPEPVGQTSDEVEVEIEAPDACRRYAAMVVRGVQVGPSPAWMQQRLEAVGLRPRNNLVDITNYVMYESGQPLHAFDLDQIAGSKIIVRQAEKEERFTTLDSMERKLPKDALLICDRERPVAIAGVMGGENSEVTEATTNVLIESAYFDPSTIRKTAKALGLQTDASYRFERGVDAEGQVWAAARAAQLMAELAGGEVVPGLVDAHPNPVPKREVTLRYDRLNQLLGIEVPPEEAERLLTAIGFGVETEESPLDVLAEQMMEGRSLDRVDVEGRSLRCRVPSFRPDVEREVDVIEEVARLYGYDRIAEPAQVPVPNAPFTEPPAGVLRRQARGLLSGLGFREVYTNSMLPEEVAERFNHPPLGGSATGALVTTLNPVSQEMASLRPSLLPGVLQVIRFNQNHGQRALRLFEFGHVFRRTDQEDTMIPGYAEHESVLLALSGPRREARWDTSAEEVDFFDAKGAVEALLEALRIPDVVMTPHDHATPLMAYHLSVRSGETALGTVARLSDGVAGDLDLSAPVYFAELDWHRLTVLAERHQKPVYEPVSRFPVVERDLAVVVDRAQPAGALLNAIEEAGRPLLQDVSVFDLYEGDRLASGKKSLAFRLRLAAARTLKDKEVDKQIRRIVQALQDRFGAELRG
ncbi:MAG: phenylalanine--tRNA ligase subunit beta [Rhodothermales bacterium]